MQRGAVFRRPQIVPKPSLNQVELKWLVIAIPVQVIFTILQTKIIAALISPDVFFAFLC